MCEFGVLLVYLVILLNLILHPFTCVRKYERIVISLDLGVVSFDD